ncbi:MAG: response regulator [Desulfobulbaceae bacterium]|nr:response regulator [Desulfobulbaceae bacterium]
MKNFPIRTRLLFALGAMLCLLILVTAANVLHIFHINKKVGVVSETAFPAAASSLNVKLATHEVMELINASAIASRKDILQDLPQLEETLFTQLLTIKSLEINSSETSDQHEKLLSHYITAKKAGLAWIDTTLHENWELEPIAGRKFEQSRKNLEDLIVVLESKGTNAFVQSMSDILLTTKKANLQTILFCSIGVILFVVFSIVISASISNPISSLLRVVQDLRKDKDDYSQRVEIHSQDEIGHLAQEFNKMLNEQESSRYALKKYAGKLESQVEKRTFQLQQEKKAHQESEEYLKTIFNSTSAGILIIDPESHEVLDANPFALKLIDDSLQEVIGRQCHTFICPTEFSSGAITDIGLEIGNSESILMDKNGRSLNILKTVVELYRDNKKYLLVSFIDISQLKGTQTELQTALDSLEERVVQRTKELAEINTQLKSEIDERKAAEIENKRLQEQLKTSEKMEAIGRLAGSVAHDLNNVLSGVVSYPELLLMNLSADSPLRAKIEIIKNSGEKAAAIVQDLLTLARRNVMQPKVLELNTIIEKYLASPEHEKLGSFHQHVEVALQLDPSLLRIKGSSVHISKTIMNLVSNGMEAMLSGGTLHITTKNVYLDKPLKGYDEICKGDYVVLEIKDEGIGISEDDKAKIFEPFYTKKSMGRSGTGLGMSVVWSTVKDHDSYIDLESSEGMGSVFRIFFPVTREELYIELESFTIDHIKGNGEQILIIDDHENQRDIASAYLQKLNYRTMSVDGGDAAIDYIKDHEVEMVILDMIMDPGIDGLETYRRLITIQPGLKAVIASGFSETSRVKKAQQLGAGEYIRKPYTLEKIGSAIKKTFLQNAG